MNDFQQKIANAPYSSDWFKLRNVIAHIVEEYMPRCKWYQIWEKKASIASFRWVVFMLQYFVKNLTIIQGTLANFRGIM